MIGCGMKCMMFFCGVVLLYWLIGGVILYVCSLLCVFCVI